MILELNILIIILTVFYISWGVVFLLGLFRPTSAKSTRQPTVSVIIVARDEADKIGHCLTDIINQTYPKNRYDIWVVNDHSSDGTEKVVQDLQKYNKRLYLINLGETPENFAPKKYALETAIRLSAGEIILTTDADCRCPPTWVESMIKYFLPDTGMVVGYSGIKISKSGSSIVQKLEALDFLSLMSAAAGSIRMGFPFAASGQNLAYRKKAFLEVGGFKSVKKRISGDDILLLQLIKNHSSYRIRFAMDTAALVTTIPASSIQKLINQRSRWASNGLYQKKMDSLFFIYLSTVFLLSFVLFFLVPLSLIGIVQTSIPLWCFLFKAVIDFCILWKGSGIFQKKDYLKYFPLWEILHPFFITVSGILGTVGRFNWKGREFHENLMSLSQNK